MTYYHHPHLVGKKKERKKHICVSIINVTHIYCDPIVLCFLHIRYVLIILMLLRLSWTSARPTHLDKVIDLQHEIRHLKFMLWNHISIFFAFFVYIFRFIYSIFHSIVHFSLSINIIFTRSSWSWMLFFLTFSSKINDKCKTNTELNTKKRNQNKLNGINRGNEERLFLIITFL